jgi:ADP-ribose pyrophosphatase YjhB (NUDIX family)
MARYRDTRNYDGQRGWFLPDAYLEHAEHPDAAAERILRDQFGWPGQAPRLAQIESFGGDDGPWHLVFHYLLELPEPREIQPRENVAAVEWFDLDALPAREEIAHHGWCADTLDAILPAAARA